MKKLLPLLFLLTTSHVAISQHGFSASNQIISSTNNTLEIVQHAYFSFGSGPNACPKLSWYTVAIKSDTVEYNLYYNIRGAWPAFMCSRVDTLINNNLQAGNYCILVNTNLVDFHTSLNDSIIYLVEQDTTCNISVSVNEQLNPTATELNLYPNPTNDYLFIEAGEGRNELAVQLFNLQGQLIKEVLLKKGERIDVSKLRPGLYYLKLTNPENQSQPKKFYIY